MSTIEQITTDIQQIANKGMRLYAPISGVVKSIEGNTCTIIIDGNLDLGGVRLMASESDSSDSFLVIPRVGSVVQMLSVNGDLGDMMVIKVNEAQSISYRNKGLSVVIDGESQRVQIENGTVNLKDLFETMADFIGALSIMSPVGACEVLAPLPSDFKDFKDSVNKLLY
jgi:hypothetical protein